MLAEMVETLRLTHPQVEYYSIPKLIYLSSLNDKIQKRKYVDAHLLDQYMQNVVNSDKKTFPKNQENYKKLIKEYYNGK